MDYMLSNTVIFFGIIDVTLY